MIYFFYDKTYEENRKIFLSLCKKYHPDKATGDEALMKEINSEWELYKDTYNDKQDNKTELGDVINAFWEAIMEHQDEEEEQTNYVIWRGKKYSGTEDEIVQEIALRYGGLTLLEFLSSKEWKDYLNT